jgi:hypothetical protein
LSLWGYFWDQIIVPFWTGSRFKGDQREPCQPGTTVLVQKKKKKKKNKKKKLKNKIKKKKRSKKFRNTLHI